MAYFLNAAECAVSRAPNGRWGAYSAAMDAWLSRDTYASKTAAEKALRRAKSDGHYNSERVTSADLSE